MTKQQENEAFTKMLKEFPKAFGRVSFRERLMLRTAFTYVIEEVIADIKANCDLAIEGRDIKIKELEQKLEQTEKDLADYQFNYPTIKELEKENVEVWGNLTKAKEIIKNIIRITWGEGWNYSLDWKVKAEQFIKEIEK